MTDRTIPKRISRLPELAYNLWWTWREEARALFEAIDRSLWENCEQSAVKFLNQVPDERLDQAAKDPAFLKRYDTVFRAFDLARSTTDSWTAKSEPALAKSLVAYFSAEFGLDASLPIYSGGLGVL